MNYEEETHRIFGPKIDKLCNTRFPTTLDVVNYVRFRLCAKNR